MSSKKLAKKSHSGHESKQAANYIGKLFCTFRRLYTVLSDYISYIVCRISQESLNLERTTIYGFSICDIRTTIYGLQSYRHNFRHSLILHGHTIDGVGRLHGNAVVGNEDDLGFFADVLNDFHEAHEVCIVQGRIDLIHQ